MTDLIKNIGIDICTNCPYPDDCIVTDSEPCHLVQAEVDRVKAREKEEERAKERAKERAMIDSIMDIVRKMGPLSLPEIRSALGYNYDTMARLVRLNKLPAKRVTRKNKKVILIIDKQGVK
jgi:hypothetical protein